MRLRGRRWILASALVCVAFGVGCADGDKSVAATSSGPVELAPIGDPGVDRAPFPIDWGQATAAGTDLVVISAGVDSEITAALRHEDATWWALPPLPFTGFIQLATAGDRAVAGGVACTNSRCTDGEVAFAMLNEDHTDWARLDVPDIDMPVDETELTTSRGPSQLAEFSIGASLYSVDDRGELVDWTPQPIPGDDAGSSEFRCAVGDTYASMRVNYLDPNDYELGKFAQEMSGDVYVQPFGGVEAPVPVAPVPPGTGTTFGYFCAGDNMIIEGNGTESVFHIKTRTWEVTPSNFKEVTGGYASPIAGRLAVAPDGSTVFLTGGSGPVSRRSSPGSWEQVATDGHVFATDAKVLVIGVDQNVTVVWPQ